MGQHQARKTHCKHGHPFDEENTRWYAGRRYCGECHTRRGANRRRVTLLGVTQEQYDQMLQQQGGVCAICGRTERHLTKRGKRKGLSVDHDHKTGAVRSLLCDACNKGLGHFEDNPEFLGNALKYVIEMAS